MITHMIRLMRDWGVRDILVNLHHQPGPILEHLLRHGEPGVRICMSYEPAVLGTQFIRTGPLRHPGRSHNPAAGAHHPE